jgi:hypothetical protein
MVGPPPRTWSTKAGSNTIGPLTNMTNRPLIRMPRMTVCVPANFTPVTSARIGLS